MIKYIRISKAQEKNKILKDKARQNKRTILQSEKCSHLNKHSKDKLQTKNKKT